MSAQAFKSHFINSEALQSSRITDIIKGYALVETQKSVRRKTLKQLLLPSLSACRGGDPYIGSTAKDLPLTPQGSLEDLKLSCSRSELLRRTGEAL
jgi:hypothetical protein